MTGYGAQVSTAGLAYTFYLYVDPCQATITASGVAVTEYNILCNAIPSMETGAEGWMDVRSAASISAISVWPSSFSSAYSSCTYLFTPSVSQSVRPISHIHHNHQHALWSLIQLSQSSGPNSRTNGHNCTRRAQLDSLIHRQLHHH